LEEPTETLPVVPPRVGARTVIVYERRSWGLLVLTGLLVALTAGVILGQTIAFQPSSHTGAAAAAAAEITPSASASAEAGPSASPSTSTGPSAARLSAPLGRTTAQTFEVSGNAALVSVVAADLGDRLYDIAGLDDSAVPSITATRSGPVLTFIPTSAPGRAGATVQLNEKVRWTLRFTGSTSEQSIDLRTGKLAGLDLAGGTGRVVLRLPAPKGTVPLRITGDTGTLDVLTGKGVLVRLKLGQGADTAVVDAKTRTKVKPATTITPPGWSATTNRYDLTTQKKLTSVRVTRD
jgi:hypothetical protein